MHTYAKPDPTAGPPPSISTFTFKDALDVVRWAELDSTVGWRTWPEVWHLDDAGGFRCYHKASSPDSIREWAKNAASLRRSRLEAPREDCPSRWVVVESRQPWMMKGGSIVDESDAEASRRCDRGVSASVHLLIE